MKLLTLNIINFKGIRELSIVCDGENLNIYGDNATGKTTVFDAVTWLLFGKNSEDVKDFGIKTRIDGEEMHKAEHIVEAVFLHNDKKIKFKRIYKEKYSKPKGTLTELYTGNTTDYFVDDVPKKQGEYQDYINSIADEKLFKLLSNPLYFNEGLKWQERRSILTEICGDITESEVIAGSEGLTELTTLLNGKTIEDFKLSVKASAKKTKTDLESIPARIDENLRSIVDIESVEQEKQKLEGLKQQSESLMQKIADALSSGAGAEIKQELSEVNSNLFMINANKEAHFEEARAANQKHLLELRNTVHGISMDFEKVKAEIQRKEMSISACATERERLLQEFSKLKDQVFATGEKIETSCPTCGQYLPEDIIVRSRQKAQEQEREFNTNKAKRLSDINMKGIANNTEKTKLENELGSLSAEYAKLSEQLASEKIKLEDMELEFKNFNFDTFAGAQFFEDRKKLQEKIVELQAALKEPEAARSAVINSLKEQKRAVDEEISKHMSNVAAFENNQLLHKRVEELKAKEEYLSAQYTELQRQLYLADEFTRKKTEYVNAQVVSKFKMARFEMFRNNISNEGMEECCEVTYRGVPYCDLNNAARINIGLDIINTLSEYYQFTAPVFMDNAESVTGFIDTPNTQIIKLIVSEQDKQLRIQTI